MNVVWSRRAEEQVREALRAERRERALGAFQWMQRLMQRVGVLGIRASRGYLVPELPRPRVAQMLYGAHRLIFRVEAERIVVLAFASVRKGPYDHQRDRDHHGE